MCRCKKYFKTDDLQWCRKANDANTVYDFVEVRLSAPGKYVFVTGSIDLESYDGEDIEDCIRSYGYEGVEDVKKKYPNDWRQVIAECLFEETSEMELGFCVFGPFRSEDDAEKAAESYIKVQEAGRDKPQIKQMQFC